MKISCTNHAKNEQVLHRVRDERNILCTVQRRSYGPVVRLCDKCTAFEVSFIDISSLMTCLILLLVPHFCNHNMQV